jgi:hypothetical protein
VYAQIYDRLCGWLFAALGAAGFACGGVPGYIHLSRADSAVYVIIGWLLVAAARFRHRTAVLAAVWMGVLLFLWGVLGLTGSTVRYGLGSAEPLECALHLVAGAWGMYIAVQDVLDWRRS